ncbi:MAG: DUF3843 family protein, partial [Muribaculaceae bacterium]|nr:DUF3843 family protein [Muribaculaceae bacterium]
KVHRENNDFSLGMKEAVYSMEAELGLDSNCSMADVPTWEILSRMARQMGYPECADLLLSISVRPYQAYNMSPLDRISMKLTDVLGEEYILDYRPQKSDPYFSDYKSLFGNLVKFGDKWLVNGISSSSYSPLKNTASAPFPVEEMPKEVMEHLREVIRKNDGRKVYYCSSLKEVKEIVGNAIPIPVDGDGEETDDLLLLLSEEKPMALYANLCRIFADPENPFYDPAADENGELAMDIVMSDLLQPDVMEYVVTHNLLPSARVFASQGKETGKRLIQENLLFLMRFFEVTHTDIDAFDAPDEEEEEDYDEDEQMV